MQSNLCLSMAESGADRPSDLELAFDLRMHEALGKERCSGSGV